MMRLMDATTYSIEPLQDIKLKRGVTRPDVPYVILSHRWIQPEVVFLDAPDFKEQLERNPQWEKAASARKIIGFCRKASEWSYEDVRRRCEKKDMKQHDDLCQECSDRRVKHVWLDTCCINQADEAEKSTSIQSMYQWYDQAEVCFVYLSEQEGASNFTKDPWFTRGWTLQELVAPKSVEFYDRNWKLIGTKDELVEMIAPQTGIASDILLHRRSPSEMSVAHRMSWVAHRETTEAEDMAYCLLGFFDVRVSAFYRIGIERAFGSLQEEIVKTTTDYSLFAWQDVDDSHDCSGMLAPSPKCFQKTGRYLHKPERGTVEPFSITTNGVSIALRLQRLGGYRKVWIGSFDCPVGIEGDNLYLAVYLIRLSGNERYCRILPQKLCKGRKNRRGDLKRVYVDQPDEKDQENAREEIERLKSELAVSEKGS